MANGIDKPSAVDVDFNFGNDTQNFTLRNLQIFAKFKALAGQLTGDPVPLRSLPAGQVFVRTWAWGDSDCCAAIKRGGTYKGCDNVLVIGGRLWFCGGYHDFANGPLFYGFKPESLVYPVDIRFRGNEAERALGVSGRGRKK